MLRKLWAAVEEFMYQQMGKIAGLFFANSLMILQSSTKLFSMMITELRFKDRFRILSTISLVVIVLLTSCSRKINFTNSTIVPAARGSVEVKKDKNNNYAIDIDIRHLAEPDRLPQPKQLYVVWIESENGIQNIGQLKTSTGLITETLKASMKAISPYKPTRVIITAEDQANIQAPGDYIVLNTTSF